MHQVFQSTPPVKAATTELGYIKANTDISIHAAREGGDFSFSFKSTHLVPFQSTPPVKAATPVRQVLAHKKDISIHAAREGGDFRQIYSYRIGHYFNPRRP